MNIIAYALEYNRYLNGIGILVVLALAWLFSHNRARINYRTVGASFGLLVVTAAFVLKVPLGQDIIKHIADGAWQLYTVAEQGTHFVFGSLALPDGPAGFVFAFRVLPIIIFFGALMSLLFHMEIIQRVVGAISYVLQPLLHTSGAETLCAIANSFLGQTESPLLVRHYLKDMTRSEIMLVMISGMGTISGSILVVYASIGVPIKFLLSASFMAVPATILIAKILYPETEHPKTMHGAAVEVEVATNNALEAVAQGTSDGLQLALNVGAMLVAFMALIGLINALLGYACMLVDMPPITLQFIFGYLFSPFGWLLGLQGDEIRLAGELIGIKMTINEMFAFMDMVKMHLSERAIALLTFALCGFANFSCIGIQIGGIGALATNKRSVLSELGFKAVFGATLANLLSALVAGLFL